jgi:hypothetical protein
MSGSLIEAALPAVFAGICVYCGVQGIRGEPVWPASESGDFRGAVLPSPAKGQAARWMGTFHVAVGIGLGAMSLVEFWRVPQLAVASPCG